MTTTATMPKTDEIVAKMFAIAPTVETAPDFYGGVAGLASEFDITIGITAAGVPEHMTALHLLPDGDAKLFIDGADQPVTKADVLAALMTDPASDDSHATAIHGLLDGAWKTCKSEPIDKQVVIDIVEPIAA